MVSGSMEAGGEVIGRSREMEFFAAQETLDASHAALLASVGEYDVAFETYEAKVAESLTGAEIIVSSCLVQQRTVELNGQQGWQQTSDPITTATEMTLAELTVSARHESDLPTSPDIWAEARVNSGVDSGIGVRFWLHNATWTFKPTTAES